jgi:replicative superfamily II helicase
MISKMETADATTGGRGSGFREVCQSMSVPEEISQSYLKKGLNHLHLWQMECLYQTNVLNGENLIYCAPTGGGKTLVAELIILKTVIYLKKRAMLILPYVSLVTEKEREFKRLVMIYNRTKPISERIRIKGYHGESKSIGKLKEHILICTIEKANSITNALISRGLLNQLGCVVVDEMHVLGDFHRGFHLEILIRSDISLCSFLSPTTQQTEIHC